MDTTPRLKLPYIAPQQAQKQVTYNEAMRSLDVLVQPVVKSRTLATPPGSPAEGDAYLVATGPTGAWAAKDGKIACYLDGAWMFHTPLDGWLLYVEDDAEFIRRQAGMWNAIGGSYPTLGVNATPDFSTRLAVAADASRFSHDGTSHRLSINKAAAADTASLLLQTAASGRAEIGLAGDDDLRIKVSADGATWKDVLLADRTSGLLTLPAGQLKFPTTQLPSSDPTTLDDYREGSWTPGLTFGGASVGITYGASNGGRYTRIGRLCVATFFLQLSSKGSSTGSAVLTGLPFTSISSAVLGMMLSGWANGMSAITGAIQGAVASGGTTLSLYGSGTGASSALTNIAFTNSSQLQGVIIYDVA